MKGFRFGLEAEFLLARKEDFRPLWHQDISFKTLNHILEGIPLEGTGGLGGLELEPPHSKLMPYVVEGYHVPDQNLEAIDIKPKGVEIRTPVASTLDGCLGEFEILLQRLQTALAAEGLAPVALSHHPTETKFTGPQNKRRHDYWQWAMEVMTTYGPDINVAVPTEVQKDLDVADLEAKIDHYGPSLAALSVASPFVNGDLWRIRGAVGRSFRMYKRSVIAPPIEIHPDEDWRLEFKVFDMPNSTLDFRCQFLGFLALLATPELKGRASKQSRIYDLGQVARFGLQAETVQERLGEIFKYAPRRLEEWGFDARPLNHFAERLASGRTPADEMIELYQKTSMAEVLASRAQFQMEKPRT
jgi:lambda repressor-like predicted transcriptional regulator